MASMTRRLDALEQIAEEVRQRPWRNLAIKRGLPVDRFLAEAERMGERVRQMERVGPGVRQIIAAFAAELGISVEQFEAEAEQILREMEDASPA